MPWSQPVERMRELVLAIRAIWATLARGHAARLPRRVLPAHADDAVLQPRPEPLRAAEHLPGRRRPAHDRDGRRGRRRVHRAPVRDRAIAARADDSRARARRRARRADRSPTSRSRSRSWPSSPTPTSSSTRGRDAMRPRLAFYGSTPAYKVILDVHGWGDLQPELNRLSKTGDWATMSALITDEMVDAFSVQGTPDEIGADRPRALRRPRAAHLVRHQRPARPRPRRGRSSPASAAKRPRLTQRERAADRASDRARYDHVVPRDVDDPPARGFDHREPAAVALPREPGAVVLEPVALARDPARRPREVEPIATDRILTLRPRERALAEQARQPHLEPRLQRARAASAPRAAAGPRRSRPATPAQLIGRVAPAPPASSAPSAAPARTPPRAPRRRATPRSR